jgi:uncharacterized membrane protein
MGETVTPFLYAIAAGVVVGVASLVEKLGLATTQPYAGLFVRSGAVIVFLGLSAIPLARYADWSGFTPRAIIFLALGGLLAGLVAHFLYWQSLKATDPHFALPIFVATSQAAVVVLSAVFLRARVSSGQLLGVLLLVAGVSLIQLTRPS